MTAIVILPYQNGAPVFPEGFAPSGWSVKQEILNDVGTPTLAMLVVQITEEEFTAASTKQIPTIDWCYRIPVEDGATTFTVQDAVAMRAQDLFQVKLDALTRDGFTDPVTGIKLKCTSDKVFNNWIAQGVFALMAKSVGASTGETPIETFDFNDQPVTLTTDQFFGLMLRMGNDFFAKFKQAAS